MLRKIVSYGLLAGLVVAVPLCVLVVATHGRPVPYGEWIGYATMLLAFSLVFVAVKRHRDHARGGVIGFWPALGLGLGISAVASLVYVLAWEALLAFTGIDFAAGYAELLIEQRKAAGASAEALAKLSADMQAFKAEYANPLVRLPMTFAEIFPVGVLVSLAAAGLLRNRRFLPLRRM
ncbi:DUF4199 domain-containing protein [Dokdonella sp.]|uniref:DUF4199 domain-containing protein n=1 Tax=Dokdonella sp. TaxID=2291710 RepID=UPI002618FBF0|nr:DUF4199 domain-containing protein [Dokdonella sp.]